MNFQECSRDKNKSKILAWRKKVTIKKVKIFYRANRAVAFNPDRFQETDEASFTQDYLRRRINITPLLDIARSDTA